MIAEGNPLPRLVRPATPADAQSCLEIYAPVVLNSHSSFETRVPDAETYSRRIAGIMRDFPWLVCESGAKVVGYAYASRYRERVAYQWSVEVSAYVADGYRRAGVARSLYGPLLDTLRRQGFRNAYAVIAQPNAPSVAFHESMGFRYLCTYHEVGFKMGRWYDVGWWWLRLNDSTETPSAPIPYSRLHPAP